MKEGNCGPMINADYDSDAVIELVTRSGGTRTLKVLRTLPLLTRLADDFDWPTGESSDDPLGFIVPNRSDDLNKSLHLFLLFIHIGDEKLFPDTTAYICCTSWRVGDVERFPHSCRPLNVAFLTSGLARD